MKLRSLSGRKVCERVKTKGLLWKGTHVQARILVGTPRTITANVSPGLYVGTLTSAKLDKSAVKRNRMRRRCKEALRVGVQEVVAKTPLKTSFQLILLPRSSSLSAPFGELLADLHRLILFLPTIRVTRS
jgi:ribonuclease P protein component